MKIYACRCCGVMQEAKGRPERCNVCDTHAEQEDRYPGNYLFSEVDMEDYVEL